MIGSFLWNLILWYFISVILYYNYYVCCVIYNMLTVLNLDIFLFTIVIGYFTFILLFTCKRQKIVLMSFSGPLIFSSSRASFVYLALDTSTPYIVYTFPPLIKHVLYSFNSNSWQTSYWFNIQYHKQNRFIRGSPCILNNLMSELFLIISVILYFHAVCLIINNSFLYAVNPCFSKLNTWHNAIFQGLYPYYLLLLLLLVRLITRKSQPAEWSQLSSLVHLSSHTASGVMMFHLTMSVVWDVGMLDIFAVCVLLSDLLFHRYIVVMVLDSSFCACVNWVCCDQYVDEVM